MNRSRRSFQTTLPGLDLSQLDGLLVVLEGPDSAGRSTQMDLLSRWLEQKGYPVARTGLKRSALVAEELEQAKQGNILSPRTMDLFYATDFYDQLENRILPALKAGFVVLADRYVFTLQARALVRGGDPEWLESLYGMAVVPDALFYLNVSTQNLLERTLAAHGSLDYWESGMDLGISRDWHDSFLRYQRRMRVTLKGLMEQHHGILLNADRPVNAVQQELRAHLESLLERREKRRG